MRSSAVMCVTCLILWTTAITLLLAYLHLHVRIAAACRSSLRLHAERLIIEKRWMERHAKSPAKFEARWNAELGRLHRAHASRPVRFFFRRGDFERALNAELACILDREVASWTFVDRTAHSPKSFEGLVLRCLAREGWRLDYQDGTFFVLIRDRKRIIVHLRWTGRDLECLAVNEVAATAERIGCRTACVITNGRLGGAAAAMADELDVVFLHCSQLDLLTPQLAAVVTSRSTPREDLRFAA